MPTSEEQVIKVIRIMTTYSCIILKKGCDITLESGVKSLSACRYARKKPVKSTIFRG